MTKQSIKQLYIVGGGGQNELLNQLTADLTDKLVFIGPSETTAIGNVLMQLITMGTIRNLREGRQVVADSFGLKTFKPQTIDRQDRKSTRLNSSHVAISYAVFCLKKKKTNN